MDKAQLYDDLCKLDELLDSEDKWIKGTSARNDKGIRTTVLDPNAVAWCIGGACTKICGGVTASRDLRKHLRKFITNKREGIIDYNDHKNTTFTGVKRLIQRAKKGIE